MIKHYEYIFKSIIGGAGLGLAVSGLLSFFDFFNSSPANVSAIVFVFSSIVTLSYIYSSISIKRKL